MYWKCGVSCEGFCEEEEEGMNMKYEKEGSKVILKLTKEHHDIEKTHNNIRFVTLSIQINIIKLNSQKATRIFLT